MYIKVVMVICSTVAYATRASTDLVGCLHSCWVMTVLLGNHGPPASYRDQLPGVSCPQVCKLGP